MYRKQPTKNSKVFQNIAIELSWDHKPTRPGEKERIRKKGGKIERITNDKGKLVGPYRVWEDEEGPGIAMSRSLGDFSAKRVGLISEPEVQNLQLTQQDQFIIIASDGVWDVCPSSEAVGFVMDQIQNKGILEKSPPANNIAEALVMFCRKKWDDDNAKKFKQKKNVEHKIT